MRGHGRAISDSFETFIETLQTTRQLQIRLKRNICKWTNENKGETLFLMVLIL